MPVTINGSTGLTGVAAIDNVSSTELGYLDGVTSALQTQINGIASWTTWTPTYTNLTIGNGTVISKYALLNKVCLFRYYLKFGSTTSISGTPKISLPFALNQAADFTIAAFPATYHDSGSQIYIGNALVGLTATSNDAVELTVQGAAGTYTVSSDSLTASIPMTWTTNDKISFSGLYEVA